MHNPYDTPVVSDNSQVRYVHAGMVDDGVIQQLLGTRPWVRMFSVILFIGLAFMALAGIGMFFSGAVSMGSRPARSLSPFGGGGFMIAMGAIYLLLAMLYIFPGVKLWKYASRISRLEGSRSMQDLEQALNEQRAFWKFSGVALIVMICLYIVAIVTIAISAAISASGGMR